LIFILFILLFMHIHILGICGTFMGGIAALAKAAGHRVTGCDEQVYPPMSTQLEALGIELTQGFGCEQMALAPDVYVVGNVMKRGLPIMEAILNQNLNYVSGPEWLAQHVLKDKWVLSVAGTHGKTTTASMLAWILEFAGLAPGFLIGGIPENFSTSARLPLAPRQDAASLSPFFVLEADEYDTAFFDKRSKFVHYRARTVVLNNLEFDHADIFADLAAIETQFHHMIRTIPAQGLVVCNGLEPNLARTLARGCWTPVTYFAQPTGWHAQNVASNNHFDVYFAEKHWGRVAWDIMGEHNRYNALAAIAAAQHVGVMPDVAIKALAEFKNVKRRMEWRGEVGGVTIYDDFAHHPTAIAMTLAGLRARVGNARILAVLEPRSNTMKQGAIKEALAPSLAVADEVFCYTNGVTWSVDETMQALGDKLHAHDNLDALVADILKLAQAGDQILVMSNGGFGGIHQRLLSTLPAER
jgi:UDP-N-acetylmuramate: L-alanyl-gamma-D-glutamyl-meso-diaminopimelate ligase